MFLHKPTKEFNCVAPGYRPILHCSLKRQIHFPFFRHGVSTSPSSKAYGWGNLMPGWRMALKSLNAAAIDNYNNFFEDN